MLVTSREPLQIEGEVLHRVPSLSIPSERPARAALSNGCSRSTRTKSVQLLVDRGRTQRPDFELTSENVDAVASVCRQLDGIPLAIELAASRLRSMSIEDLSARLDHQYGLLSTVATLHARHQTLTALFDSSYELLSGSRAATVRAPVGVRRRI